MRAEWNPNLRADEVSTAILRFSIPPVSSRLRSASGLPTDFSSAHISPSALISDSGSLRE
jgi:hypothetical protein